MRLLPPARVERTSPARACLLHRAQPPPKLIASARRVSSRARAMAAAGHNLGTVELLALLRDGSLKPDSIAEEMACAGAHPCTAAQIAEARELLGLLQQERTAQSAGLAAEGAAAEPEVARRI